jgi:hypothetical protein
MNPYVNGTYDLKRINENSGEYLLRRIIYNLKLNEHVTSIN